MFQRFNVNGVVSYKEVTVHYHYWIVTYWSFDLHSSDRESDVLASELVGRYRAHGGNRTLYS